MNEKKKIEIQQDIISRLTEENNSLRAEIAIYKEEKDNIDIMKQDLESKLDKMNELITQLNEAKLGYNQKLKEIFEIKKKYQKQLTGYIKSVKKTTKKIR